MSKYAKDEALLEQLSAGRDADWRALYEDLRSPFRMYFLKHTQQSPETVSQLYQDAMVVLHRKVTTGSLQAPLSSSLTTYLIGVGKMLWRKQRNNAPKWNDEIPEVPVPPGVENRLEQAEQARWVRDLLGRMGDKCRAILEKVYLLGYSMEAVAEDLSLSSAGAARKRKFDCLQRMKALIKTTDR